MNNISSKELKDLCEKIKNHNKSSRVVFFCSNKYADFIKQTCPNERVIVIPDNLTMNEENVYVSPDFSIYNSIKLIME